MISYIFNIYICIYIAEGNGKTPRYSCLQNPVDRGAWCAAVQRVTQSQTQLKQLSSSSMFLCLYISIICFIYFSKSLQINKKKNQLVEERNMGCEKLISKQLPMENKVKKRYSISVKIKDMQIKTKMRSYYSPVWLENILFKIITVVRTFLVVQWLKICLAIKGMWVWSLVRELRSHVLWSSSAWMPQLLGHSERSHVSQWSPDTTK